ncbi:MAG: hypothetical protein FWB80_00875 [Defluviitaleaceae bacterium]|nr:hypothetical protein [Defluviitaleaceae bacterium]
MQKKKIATSTLLQRLFKTSSINRFFNHYGDEMQAVTFHEYINDLCAKKGITAESVLRKTDIERTYGHQLFRGIRKPTRDRVIQLAFGFGMNYDELQKLLSIARKSPLYPKIRRDAIIIYALKNEYSIIELQNALHEMELPILGEER